MEIPDKVGPIQYLHCMSCGKSVSSRLYPVETDTPDKGLIVRAYIECPECMEGKINGKSI